ncbi:hypothetical protein [Streptomyces sp. WELS2]|uniref:hypothetical protein n=1 Tax=Streptomyces sp. WELS2 TaxID=2749435 RepID=UPI0015F0599C|nr:hypothetical protein [Streptomyces sp. WELS2]
MKQPAAVPVKRKAGRTNLQVERSRAEASSECRIGAVAVRVWNRRLDLVAADYSGYALHVPVVEWSSARPVNIARYELLLPAARAFPRPGSLDP